MTIEELEKKIRDLEEINDGLSWCIHEAMDALEEIGCCHGHNSRSTPPMFLREYIYCVAKNLKSQAKEARFESPDNQEAQ